MLCANIGVVNDEQQRGTQETAAHGANGRRCTARRRVADDCISRAAVAAEPRGSTPEEFAVFVRDQHAKMGKLVKDANVKGE